MKKITVLVSQQHVGDALGKLRKLGIIHIEHVQLPAAEGITHLEHKLIEINQVLQIIKPGLNQKCALEQEQIAHFDKEILSLHEEQIKINHDLEQIRKKINWFNQWGNVSLASLHELQKNKVFIKLYVCASSFLKKIPAEKIVQVLSQTKNNCRLALISQSENDSLDCYQEQLPDKELAWLNKHEVQLVKRQEEISHWLEHFNQYYQCFLDYQVELTKKLEFFQARFGMGQAVGINYLQGYCPDYTVTDLDKTAQQEGWAILSQEPDNPEQAPTLLQNKPWIKIIFPVLKFMGILPGYAEFDVSACFLIFFSLFCSMLVGDAGYGLLFIGLAFFLQKRVKALPKELVFLIYTLGIGTVIWGAITGTWFGWEGAARLPIVKSLIIANLNSWVEANQPKLMWLCFLIGAIHLTTAHLMAALAKKKSPAFIAELAWIGVVWSMFFYANYFVLNMALPSFSAGLLLISAILVLLFVNFQTNFIIGLKETIGLLPLILLGFISAFADVVSYIRLFAVGFAGTTISSTFNTMLLNNKPSFFMAILALIALAAAHIFNILLGLIAIFVHGIRLNLLEFSSHSGLQWTGKEYKPFKE